MDPVVQAVAAAIDECSGRVLVGFSGGLDSTVLLHAAAAAVVRHPRSLTAIHVNHGLQSSAPGWERHCHRVCAGLGVALEVGRVDAAGRGSVEARARAARYGAFDELLSPGDRLLLAHHADDQAETVLLRMLQGRGLYGMPAARRLGQGELMRPLLELPRSAVVAYAQHHRLEWIEDPSNADETLDRNFLRHRLMPVLRERWPALDQRLRDAMVRARETDQRLAAQLRNTPHGVLPIASIGQLAPTVRPELLRLWLEVHGVAAPGRAGMKEFLRQLDAGGDRQPRLEVAGGSLRRYRDAIYLVMPPPRLALWYRVPVPGDLRLPHGRLKLVPDAAGVAPLGPVTVRFRAGGETLRSGAHHRSVKHLLQEAGVPPWRRPEYPLLYDALGLLALPGIAVADRDRGLGMSPLPGPACRIEWHPDRSA